MRLLPSLLFGALALAVALPAIAAEERKSSTRKRGSDTAYDTERRSGPARNARTNDNDYAARASSADPSGDFKGYPDWARAGVGTKPSSR